MLKKAEKPISSSETDWMMVGFGALLVVAVILNWPRRKDGKASKRLESPSPKSIPSTSSTVGINNIPKEMTDTVPREWKPSSRGCSLEKEEYSYQESEEEGIKIKSLRYSSSKFISSYPESCSVTCRDSNKQN